MADEDRYQLLIWAITALYTFVWIIFGVIALAFDLPLWAGLLLGIPFTMGILKLRDGVEEKYGS
ncbi:hypothetical protein [Salininema proteolyticum]|uniref:Uncharacterized protein n=1 Tax=Salininema proteolyticum TaxID=1607685 RepID=A0ABV8U4K5_9ACTN